MASTFDEDYPMILSMELDRPHPQYIFRWCCQPQFLVDTSKQPGESFQMDRYLFFGDTGDLTLDSRERQPDELIGTQSQRDIPKEKVLVRIAEYTGPGGGDPDSPTQPGHMKLSRKRIETSMRNLFDRYQFEAPMQPEFHESIGAISLLDDYRRWQDRVYQHLLNRTPHRFNPGNVEDGGTYDNGPPRITVEDFDNLYEILRRRNVPTFPDGYYYAVIDDRMMRHIRQDERFREVVTSSAHFNTIPENMVRDTRLFGPGQMPPANPMNYMAQPNQLAFQGPGLNQSVNGAAGAQMPAGIVFNGFRFFTSNNIFNEFVNLNYTNSTNTAKHATGMAQRRGYLGFVFGPNAIGEAMGSGDETGMPVRIRKNLNDDYQRFLILIWQMFGGFAVLNENYIQVVRTYGD